MRPENTLLFECFREFDHVLQAGSFVAALLMCGGLAEARVLTPGPNGVATDQARSSDMPVAVATRLERAGAVTKLSFDLSRFVDVKTYVLENPDRIVIEAPEINFQIESNVAHARPGFASVVRSYRFGQFAAGRSRIVVDLAGPARVQKVDVVPIVAGGDPARLTIQLARSDRASFHEQARAPTASSESPVATTRTEVLNDSRPVIVIDPGHGGVDPGARGLGGVVEKTIVFDFAAALVDKLKAAGHYRVLLTRSGDTFVTLADRVRTAREAKAQLFVSVHADTVADGPAVAGATVYTASDRASDAEAARVAATENKADELAGVEPAPEASEVSDILFDLTRRETRTFSHTFQRTLAGYWQKIARLNKNPERSAGFMVLKAPDVPSVLLELGYLSSEQDVAALTSPAWRNKAAGTVAASIDAFFAAQARDQHTAGAQIEPTGADPDKSAIVLLRPHL